MGASFVYDAVRTPFGRYGKALAGVRPDDLAASTLRALLDRHPDLDPATIDDVLLGDASKANQALGWIPEISLADMVAEMVDADLARHRARMAK